MIPRILILLFLLITPMWSQPATAQPRSQTEARFHQWLETTLWPKARAAKVSRTTFDRAFAEVSLNWKLPDLAPPGTKPGLPSKQRQAEFGAPARYFGQGGLNSATAIGRQMARKHATALARAEQATGVPGRIILAIWGRESGFGRAAIPHDAFQTLGTLGFMGRRAEYFTDELIAALRIAEAGHAPSAVMKSSFAGALGQPQFMPSSFLKYARDGNGDGHADIWRSETDTIASIAHYLDKHGWITGRDWGFEVTVPETLSCSLEGPDQARPISDWETAGIRRINNRPFPAHERRQSGSLLMPAGRHGPAFIVTPNFYVLKDYNFSDLYALFVGHVGDRIQFGSGNFATKWAGIGQMYRSDIARMQRALEHMGHDVGGADGLPGFRTRRSIGRWQAENGQTPTCFPTSSLLKTFGK